VTAYEEDGDNPSYHAFSFRLTEQTQIVTKSGEAVTQDELRVGAQVEAWHTGLVKESYPAQVDAVKFVILDEEVSDSEAPLARAEAIRIAIEAQTEVAGPWVVQHASLDEEQ